MGSSLLKKLNSTFKSFDGISSWPAAIAKAIPPRESQTLEPPAKRAKTAHSSNETLQTSPAVEKHGQGAPTLKDSFIDLSSEKSPKTADYGSTRANMDLLGVGEFRDTDVRVRGESKGRRKGRRRNSHQMLGNTLPFSKVQLAPMEGIEDDGLSTKPPAKGSLIGGLVTSQRNDTSSKRYLLVADGADGQILRKPPPTRRPLYIMQGQPDKARVVSDIDSPDELAESNPPTRAVPLSGRQSRTRLQKQPVSLSIEKRGDIASTKWNGREDGLSMTLPIISAVAQPDHTFSAEEDNPAGRQLTLTTPTAASPSARAHLMPGKDEAPASAWLSIDLKTVRRVQWHPGSSIVRIERSTDSKSLVPSGAALGLQFGATESARNFVNWAKKSRLLNEDVFYELDGEQLLKQYRYLYNRVKDFAGKRERQRQAAAHRQFANAHEDSNQIADKPRHGRRTTRSSGSMSLDLTTGIENERAPPREPRLTGPNGPIVKGSDMRPGKILSVEPVDTFTKLNPSWDKDWLMPLVYHRTSVEKDDISRLDEGQCLNDNLINFYLKYLAKSHPESSDRVYIWNTFFYEKLRTGKGKDINFDGVKKWTAKVDLFKYDYVIVPVNESFHWWVAVICWPKRLFESAADEDEAVLPHSAPIIETAEPTAEAAEAVDLDEVTGGDAGLNASMKHERSKPKPISLDSGGDVEDAEAEPRPPPKKLDDALRIITLDSFGANHSRTCTHLKQYLMAELKDKRPGTAYEEPKKPGTTGKHIPQQDNFSDCGVYLLGYMEKFLENPDVFVRDRLSKEAQSWDFDASKLRKQVRDLILRLQEQYQEGVRSSQRQRKAVKAHSKSPGIRLPESAGRNQDKRIADQLAKASEVSSPIALLDLDRTPANAAQSPGTILSPSPIADRRIEDGRSLGSVLPTIEKEQMDVDNSQSSSPILSPQVNDQPATMASTPITRTQVDVSTDDDVVMTTEPGNPVAMTTRGGEVSAYWIKNDIDRSGPGRRTTARSQKSNLATYLKRHKVKKHEPMGKAKGFPDGSQEAIKTGIMPVIDVDNEEEVHHSIPGLAAETVDLTNTSDSAQFAGLRPRLPVKKTSDTPKARKQVMHAEFGGVKLSNTPAQQANGKSSGLHDGSEMDIEMVT